MTGPISREDRAKTMRWVKVIFVLLVGASAGLITSQGDASLKIVVGAVVGGLLVGVALVWYLFPDPEALAPATDYEYRE
ncbi:MAG: membrane associated rhomboid family serine protease [Natronomonas sp.]|jgi:membrane associated rhomboid family serine protease